MEETITLIKKVREKAAIAANPVSSILLPMGIMILILSFIPLSITLEMRMILMVLLYLLGLAITLIIQKYYISKIGYAVPEEDRISYIVRMSGYMVFIFFTLTVYTFLTRNFQQIKYFGAALGIIAISVSLVLISLYIISFVLNTLGKETPKLNSITSRYSTMFALFVSLWIAGEFFEFWTLNDATPASLQLFLPGVFALGVWIYSNKKTTFTYGIAGISMMIISLILKYITVRSPWETHPTLHSIATRLTEFEPFRGPWLLIGTTIVILGIIEHWRVLRILGEIKYVETEE